jgi:hypothetical protein
VKEMRWKWGRTSEKMIEGLFDMLEFVMIGSKELQGKDKIEEGDGTKG